MRYFTSVFQRVHLNSSINNNGFNGVIDNIVDSDLMELQCSQ